MSDEPSIFTSPGSPSEYLLLFRGGDCNHSLSPEELQKTTAQFIAWCERLNTLGALLAGNPLLPQALLIAGGDEVREIVPGPDDDETIAGYFLIEAADLDAAVAIARQCPMLAHGGSVEVRRIATPDCPDLNRARRLVREGRAASPN